MPVIPARAPIGDAFGGALCVFRTPHPLTPADAIYTFGGFAGVPTTRGEGEQADAARYFLALNPPDGAEIVARGVVIRYGARLLGKPFLSIVPGLIALERGEMMTGETAWEFLLKRSQLFPRAEVYGYTNEGKDEMKTVKWFDLALPPMVLAYADESATVPLAEVSALAGAAGDFPARVVEYLPPAAE